LVYNEILGKEIKVPVEPQRIVSFAPAITETLFDLGLGDRVVGISPFCARPLGEVRRKARIVGSYNTVNLKLLRELQPDLIFAVTGYQRDFAKDLSNTKLSDASDNAEQFPVYPLELPVSVAGIVDMVRKISLVTGQHENGWVLSRSLLDAISSVKRIEGSPNIYVEIDLGGPVSFGALSYIIDALHILGGRTAFDDTRVEWLKPDFEQVVRLDPDVFLYEAKMYSKFDQGMLRTLIEKRGWSGLKAVRCSNFFLTPGPLDFLAHHGPAFIRQVMPWLSEKLDGWQKRQTR
jgi:iron complex transport system substrate-binding protein